jgi:hypothetical protein
VFPLLKGLFGFLSLDTQALPSFFFSTLFCFAFSVASFQIDANGPLTNISLFVRISGATAQAQAGCLAIFVELISQ